MKFIIILLVLAFFYRSDGRRLSRCGLVHELRNLKFDESRLRNWVCLVEHASSRQTDVVSGKHKDGSRDHGLFQINDKHWCSNTTKPGKECNVTCKQIAASNISKAGACAKKIYHHEGFGAWSGWKKHCEGKHLPDISSCKKHKE